MCLTSRSEKNQLVRPAIANIDQAVIVMSTVSPNFSLNLLDRFLVFLENKKMTPLIYISKLDLIDNLDEMNQFKLNYEKIGYSIYFNSDELLNALNHKVTVFMGQTGVGKTTLLNKIAPEMNLETGETSEKLGRGRHTTRHVEFFLMLLKA